MLRPNPNYDFQWSVVSGQWSVPAAANTFVVAGALRATPLHRRNQHAVNNPANCLNCDFFDFFDFTCAANNPANCLNCDFFDFNDFCDFTCAANNHKNQQNHLKITVQTGTAINPANLENLNKITVQTGAANNLANLENLNKITVQTTGAGKSSIKNQKSKIHLRIIKTIYPDSIKLLFTNNSIKIKCNMKKLFFSSVALMCFLLCLSCRDDDENKSEGRPYDPSRDVTLTNFTPEKGKILEQVLLRGDNFGNDPKIITVYFNRKKAKVVGAVGDEMFVIVPRTPGDTCTVWVVIGKDSIAYPEKFLYSKSTNVSTIAGNNSIAYKAAKNLSDCTFDPSGVFYDEVRKNIIVNHMVSDVNGSAEGHLMVINEEKNSFEEVLFNYGFLGGGATCPQLTWVDDKMYFVRGQAKNTMFSLDPNDNYRKREIMLGFNLEGHGLELSLMGMQWRGSLAFCHIDSCFYHCVDKFLVKTPYNPNMNGAPQEVVAITPFDGTAVQIAFHPVHKNMLFIMSNGGTDRAPYYENGEGTKFAGALSVLDINDPQNTLRKLNINAIGTGYRDGFLQDAQFNIDQSMMFMDHEGDLYCAQYWNTVVRRIALDMDNLTMSSVETVAGIPDGSLGSNIDGDISVAKFRGVGGVCRTRDAVIYVACQGRLRRVAVE
jgi:hypothetical protein